MSRFRSVVLSGAVLASLAGVSTPASAITMQAVFTGTVVHGDDITGLFGLGDNSRLDGLGFTMTFIYDPATPGAIRHTDAYNDQVYGGSLHGAVTPMISAQIIINGHSESVAGDYQGLAYNYAFSDGDPANDISSAYRNAYDFTDDGLTQISRQLYGLTDIASLAIPLDLETAFSLDLVDVGNALMQLYSYDRGTGTYNYFAAAGLVATHLTVSRYDVAAVPLPAALPMLLSGFAGLCILARRRKRDNIAA